MKKHHFVRRTRNASRLLLTALALVWGSNSWAACTTIDFDSCWPQLTPGSNVPFDQTAAGVTAHFSTATTGFSIQNTVDFPQLILEQFSGNYLYPNSTGGVLVIEFSQPLTNLSLNFATAEQTPIENPTPVRLTAYTNSTQTPAIGSITATGQYGNSSLPMGILSFGSALPFNVVALNIEPGGATGFLIDNLTGSLAEATVYTITAVASPVDGGTINGEGTYPSGAPVSLVATPNPGFVFANWTENGLPISPLPNLDFTVKAARTLVANFAPACTIAAAVSPSGAGAVTGDGLYPPGSPVSLVATANPGYAFVNWMENGVPVSSWAGFFFTAASNRTLVANFASACTIAADTSAPVVGTVLGAGSYAMGASVNIIAVPRTGYRFVNWTENGVPVSTAAGYVFIAAANRTLLASFIADSQSATFDFDTSTPALTNTQSCPFTQSVGGLSAEFNATNGAAFAVANDIAAGWTLTRCSSNYLASLLPDSALDIRFSQKITSIALTFATLDFQDIISPTPLQLTAFTNSADSSPVGTIAAAGLYTGADSLPMGTLSLRSQTPFDLVRLTLPPTPNGATDFIVDNLVVQAAQELQVAPRLQLAWLSAGNLALSWPTQATGFILQQSSACSGSAWTTATNQASVVGARHQVVLPPVEPQAFYRLYHP